MIKLKDLITEVNPDENFIRAGDAFKDGNSIEIAVEKFMGKWRTVSFDLQRMKSNAVGTNNMLYKQKVQKLTSSIKSKIKKITKNPEEAHFINQDDSNMVKKLLRAIK
jgi:hypothetical protein